MWLNELDNHDITILSTRNQRRLRLNKRLKQNILTINDSILLPKRENLESLTYSEVQSFINTSIDRFDSLLVFGGRNIEYLGEESEIHQKFIHWKSSNSKMYDVFDKSHSYFYSFYAFLMTLVELQMFDKLYVLIDDRKEFRYKYIDTIPVKYMFYDIVHDEHEINYFPYIQYMFTVNDKTLTEKTIRFAFGLSDYIPSLGTRSNIIRSLIHLLDSKNDKFWFDSYDDELRSIARSKLDKVWYDYNDFNEILSKSIYTLIIPSYVTTDFAMRRLIDSYCNSCAPLILEGTNYDCISKDNKLSDTLRQFQVSMNELCDIDSVTKRLNNIEMLNQLNNNSQIIEWSNKQFYKEIVNEMIN